LLIMNRFKIVKIPNFTKLKCWFKCWFKTFQNPGEDIVIDETMIPYRGRLSFKQYIPGKANKYGVKLFKLTDPSGYTYNVEI